MPRIARKYYETSIFHIIVQGINKEYIFGKEKYIKKYLEFLNKYKENYKIEILSYCIMNNHAHILIYAETIKEMSEFMHQVNTLYAQYYNYINKERAGYVFRNRYKSEAIMDLNYLINCINYIHNNPVRAKIVSNCEDYIYSSYREYMTGEKINLLYKVLEFKLDKDLFINSNSKYAFMDIDTSINDKIESCINVFNEISNFSIEEITKDRIIIRLLIKYLKKNCKIKYTEMMEYFNLSKGQMLRLK